MDTGTDPNPPAPILTTPMPTGAAEEPPAAAPVGIGDLIANKYRVERVLGMGGMGVVVAATHLELGELRAIKLMLPHVARSRAQVQRFRREARAAAQLESEHVTQVYDVGHLDDGTPYLVMEYLKGRDLRSHLEEQGALPVAAAVAYVRQTCSALAEAHAAGLVHRDIKPANLFLALRADGPPRIKLLDFGIVKATSDAASTTATTATGAPVGSALYMAPEQWNGLDLDARVDVWALGVVLYELCTGRPPFSGTTWPHICALVCGGPPRPPSAVRPDLPDLNDELDAIVLKCLEQDRARRWQSVTDLAEALAPLEAAEALPVSSRASGSRRASLPTGAVTTAPDQALSVSAEIPALPLTWSLRGRRRQIAVACALSLSIAGATAISLHRGSGTEVASGATASSASPPPPARIAAADPPSDRVGAPAAPAPTAALPSGPPHPPAPTAAPRRARTGTPAASPARAALTPNATPRPAPAEPDLDEFH